MKLHWHNTAIQDDQYSDTTTTQVLKLKTNPNFLLLITIFPTSKINLPTS